jgi:hypothetical protein
MSEETKIPGVKSAHQMVTPVCRANHGIDAAFSEALGRIKKTYTQLAGSPHNDGVTWHLVLVREEVALNGETGTQTDNSGTENSLSAKSEEA